ncbi:hypothetical protein CHS0354_042211 [Potamilus streckersoni]|uniref:Mediator of RNA polymerase II transcription subunit 26 n=1 Tax=Potamilus streckersoni TaxID=2493646 RepID=A0AAE0TP89_9BIVA|nr:hypothetical protein CHS0354_042211 [Potamilus streckersoni]
MQYTPHQLKEKLLEGLDEDNNVVDLEKVQEVIAILEKYPVTREVLEQTRIGRFVNELRRKTTNEQLAKRAKRLVKNWQKLITPASEKLAVNGERVNSPQICALKGQPKVISPALSRVSPASAIRPETQNSVKSSLSPHSNSKPNGKSAISSQNNQVTTGVFRDCKRPITSPQLPFGKRQCISPHISSQPGTPNSVSSYSGIKPSARTGSYGPVAEKGNNSQPNTPTSSSLGQGSTVHLRRNLSQESLSNLSTCSATSADSTVKSQQSVDTAFTKHSNKHDQNGIFPTGIANNQILGNNSDKQVCNQEYKQKVVNGAVRSSCGSDDKLYLNSKGISSGKPSVSSITKDEDHSSVEKIVRTRPKVRSTVDIIAVLQAKSGGQVGSEVIRQIKNNQIELERDMPQSVVPPGAKPRPRKTPGQNSIVPPSTPSSLSRTKTEMVKKFLETSLSQSASSEDLSPLKYEMPQFNSHSVVSASSEYNLDYNESATRRTLVSKMSGTLLDVSDEHIDVETFEAKPSSLSSGQVTLSSESLQPKVEPSDSKPLETLEEIYNRLPTLDLENIELDDGSYDLVEPTPVTEEEIERIQNDEWLGVNGCYSWDQSWRDWSQTLSLPSYRGDLLHILPYVIVDD